MDKRWPIPTSVRSIEERPKMGAPAGALLRLSEEGSCVRLCGPSVRMKESGLCAPPPRYERASACRRLRRPSPLGTSPFVGLIESIATYSKCVSLLDVLPPRTHTERSALSTLCKSVCVCGIPLHVTPLPPTLVAFGL